MRLNTWGTSFLFAFVFFFQIGFGQRFFQTYDADANDPYLATEAIDDGYLLVSRYNIIRTDTLGKMIWTKPMQLEAEDVAFTDSTIVTFSFELGEHGWWSSYDFNGDLLWTDSTGSVVFDLSGSKILCSSGDGEVTLIASVYDNTRRVYAEKRNVNGDVLFQKAVTTDSTLMKYVPNSAMSLADGGFLVLGSFTFTGISEMFLMRLDGGANIVWTKKWDDDELVNYAWSPASLKELPEGGFISFGRDFSTPKVIKFSGEGDIIWESNYQGYLSYSSVARKLEVLPSGNIIFIIPPSPFQNQNAFSSLNMIDGEGQLLWTKELKYGPDVATNEKIVELQYVGENQLLMGGSFSEWGNNKFMLVKTDTFGNVYPHFLTGQIFQDHSNDCLLGADEEGIKNLNIRIFNEESDFFSTTNEQGHFTFNLPEGDYQLEVQHIDYWKTCDPFNAVTITGNLDTTILNIPVQPEVSCPLLSVDISTSLIRLCNTGRYYVHYCNDGTDPAENATIEIQLADSLYFTSATAPLLSQNGQTLTFDIGTVDVFECGSFRIDFEVGCDIGLMGQTLCTHAHIYPDSLCGNTWTDPIIEVDAECKDDSIAYTITNTGGDMQQPFQYIVIEDNIILMTDDFELMEGQSVAGSVEAQSGSTYHVVAAQQPGLPSLNGSHVAVASVEGCVGTVNAGAFNQVFIENGSPFHATDCSEVRASYDPNDKTAFPSGWQDEHYIDGRTDIEYLLRFQNTGNDTAFKVVLVDTLSPFLDPATIRLGASSHPFSFDLMGQGIAVFTFDNILLPDSTTNEAASNGFVQFHISQRPENEVGTRIENTAYIYFDFNPPVQTNTVFHTIRGPWVEVLTGSVEVFEEGIRIIAYPNPFFEMAIIELEDWQGRGGIFSLIDLQGKTVLQKAFDGQQVQVERGGLSAGVYFFKIENGGRLIGSGKVAVR